MKLEFSRQIFEKYIKFHDYPSIASRVVPWGQTDTPKLTVAFKRTKIQVDREHGIDTGMWQINSN